MADVTVWAELGGEYRRAGGLAVTDAGLSFAYDEGYPVTLKFYRPDENGQKELAGLLVGWEDGFTIETEDGETVTFDKKQIAAVHAIDVWDDEEE